MDVSARSAVDGPEEPFAVRRAHETTSPGSSSPARAASCSERLRTGEKGAPHLHGLQGGEG